MKGAKRLHRVLLVAGLGCGLLAFAGAQRVYGQEAAESDKPSTSTSSTTSTTPEVNGAVAATLATSVQPTTLSVGDVAKLRIEVTVPSGVEVSLPEQPLGGLELADRRVSTAIVGGQTKTTYELDLLALESGEVEIPALTVRTVGANGELGSATGKPLKLQVSSLIANEPNAEPKPETKPLSVMRDDYTLAWVVGGLLLVALIVLVTLRVQRYLKQRPKPAAPLPPPRPAWELAYEKLHELALQRDQMFAEQRGEEFIDGVSDALREYLGRRYGFDGLERTTAELLGTLERLRPNKLSLAGVTLLLEQCDLVKFARAKPEPEACQDLWNGAIGLIRATTPTPTVAPAAGPELVEPR